MASLTLILVVDSRSPITIASSGGFAALVLFSMTEVICVTSW